MKNLLPYDGVVAYVEHLFSPADAALLFDRLLQNIAWRNEEAMIYGRHIVTKRKVAWYGTKPYLYKYSGVIKQALPWTDELKMIKEKTEQKTNESFNSCLLNLYHSGEEGMGWHSDNESSLVSRAAIASLSFGAERKFSFKHKQTGDVVSLVLVPGSLLLMKGETQIHWLHSLPKTKKIKQPRINLTFRRMAE